MWVRVVCGCVLVVVEGGWGVFVFVFVCVCVGGGYDEVRLPRVTVYPPRLFACRMSVPNFLFWGRQVSGRRPVRVARQPVGQPGPAVERRSPGNLSFCFPGPRSRNLVLVIVIEFDRICAKPPLLGLFLVILCTVVLECARFWFDRRCRAVCLAPQHHHWSRAFKQTEQPGLTYCTFKLVNTNVARTRNSYLRLVLENSAAACRRRLRGQRRSSRRRSTRTSRCRPVGLCGGRWPNVDRHPAYCVLRTLNILV